MAKLRISTDLLVMFIAALGFTLLGVVTGAFFLTILCGSCLVLIVIELIVTRGHVTE
ncbi:MAG TPA: hypothetical protein VES19_13155 [Candidatus Limnocylindrales bacterium]|nr:hypothetical protein [Candidatus Limnocylindrales bacterium]